MFQKYIIINGRPILFPHEIVHSDILGGDVKVDSAGFFTVLDQKEKPTILCFGDSRSLGARSRPEIDRMIILKFLQLKNED
jgi:hypothetical protein